MSNASETFEIRNEVRSMDDEAGMVLLDLKAGKYFSLNRVGTVIWQQVEQGRPRSQILDAVRRSFDTSEDQAQADVEAFLSELQGKGLLRGHV